MPVLGVIPARLNSRRLPRKPLQALAGVPLVVRVAQRVAALELLDELVVATDAEEVASVVAEAGFRVVLTDPGHRSGTDRVAEVAAQVEFARFDLVANLQGDEPFLPLGALEGALARVRGGDEIGTAAAPLSREHAHDPDRVKVVTDRRGRALYFSRAPIPCHRDEAGAGQPRHWQHLGVYVFSRPALHRWTGLEPTELERFERLEQLRALEHGMTIGVARLGTPALPGVDTPDDLRRAEAHWHATPEVPA
jgi:3-deoxy-manno-octulosonate cytidylyltransferase (CMP-KDO synthetase)